MSDFIDVKKKGTIAQVILSRSKAYNAFNLEITTDLASHLVSLAPDDDIRGVLITGSGQAFCAGGDLKWATTYTKNSGGAFHTLASHFHAAMDMLERLVQNSLHSFGLSKKIAERFLCPFT